MAKTITILVVFVIVAILAILALRFSAFRNWLVFAVTEAEKALGSGTGQLKLRYAYDLAIKTFPVIAKIIPFELFSWLVDCALNVMNKMIDNNNEIAKAITTTKENK